MLRSNELLRAAGQRRPSALRSSLDDSSPTDDKVNQTLLIEAPRPEIPVINPALN